uniref:MARVEL domain-containing protein n=1 Tax=Panagrolaimus sp. ES5 TaxID=591445 RepID=A0AC34FEB5_9BILA
MSVIVFGFCCALLIHAGLIAGYWALLFKVSLAHGMAIISIIYFGFCVLFDTINGVIYAVSLCCSAKPFVVAYIFGLWAIFYGLGIWGLVASIDLLSTGSIECPADGSTCTIMVILFAISLFSVSVSTTRRHYNV